MSRFLQVFCVLFSATLLSAAIPNEFLYFGSPVIGLFSLIPLYLALYSSSSYKQAFFLGFLHGSTVHLLSSFWLAFFGDFAIFTLGASYFGTGCIEAFVFLFAYFPVSTISKESKLAFQSGLKTYFIPVKVMWFSASYVLYEWTKSTGFLGYSWGTLYMTSYRWPLITQIADITGPYGISFLFACFSAVIAEGVSILHDYNGYNLHKSIITSYKDTYKALLLLIACTVCYGMYQCLKPRTVLKTLNAVLVQQNKDQWNSDEKDSILIAQNLTTQAVNQFMTENNKKPDLVVWPEGSLIKKFPGAEAYYSYFPEEEPLLNFIKKTGIPFIIGGSYTVNKEKHQNSNVALLFDKRGRLSGWYAKLHLVPFAEAIPGVQFEPVRKIIKAIAGFSYGWTGGSRYTLFDIPISTPVEEDLSETKIYSLTNHKIEKASQSVLLSTPICYDEAFEEVCRGLFLNGSELFMNITNDSWSLRKSAEYQHFVVASFRAIEYRTTLVRDTNSGYTTIISPTGKIIEDMPLFEEYSKACKIPVYKRQMTLYARFGGWLPRAIIVLMFISIFSYRLRQKSEEEI